MKVNPVWKMRLLFLLGLLAVGLFLFVVRSALPPFLYAGVITYLLAPLVEELEKRGTPRVLAILLLYAAAGGILVLLITHLVPVLVRELNAFGEKLPMYTAQVQGLVRWLQENYAHAELPASLRQVLDETISRSEQVLLSYTRSAAQLAFSLLSHALSLVIAPVLAFYMLRDLKLIKRTFAGLFQEPARTEIFSILHQIDSVLGGFVRGHLLVALIVGMLSFVGLTLLRIDFALIIGFVAGLFDIIPYFGPVIGALPAVAIALLESPLKALYVIILFLIIHQVESTIVSPKIIGQRVGLHPLVVIFALLVGGNAAGLVGLLLAVPITASAKALLFYFWKKRWPGREGTS
jgi:predicted PurR-regulated permease PerM